MSIGLEFGNDQVKNWLTSFFISFVVDLFITMPFQVLLKITFSDLLSFFVQVLVILSKTYRNKF